MFGKVIGNYRKVNSILSTWPFHYHTWRKFPSSFVNERNHKMTQIFVKYILHLCIFRHLKLEIALVTKNRTPTPVYLDPGMHPGLEVKGLRRCRLLALYGSIAIHMLSLIMIMVWITFSSQITFIRNLSSSDIKLFVGLRLFLLLIFPVFCDVHISCDPLRMSTVECEDEYSGVWGWVQWSERMSTVEWKDD